MITRRGPLAWTVRTLLFGTVFGVLLWLAYLLIAMV
mgnify:CR=1 FL=1